MTRGLLVRRLGASGGVVALLTAIVAVVPTPGMAAAPRNAGTRSPAGTQSFHDAVAAAWERLPQRGIFVAREATVAARYAAGGALVPNAPTATGTFINDRIAGSNNGYITSQVGVSTPVWLPGEGTATQNLARADAVANVAAVEAEHLALAGQVLDLAVQAIAAGQAREVATRRLATDQALATDLARRFRLGESSQSDSLAADAEAAGDVLRLQTAQAQLDVALLALATVTGTETLPRLEVAGPPVAAVAADPLAGNPRVIAADQAVEAARANARLVRIANRDDPELGLQGINEKQPGTRWDTRFGVTLTFHFATEARNGPRRAEAQQAVTQAEVQRLIVRREVTMLTRQAQAVLAATERGSVAAARAAADVETRRGQIERAWRAGEMPLIEVVRANALAFDAAYARDKARTDLAAARLRLRLAGGALP